MTTRATRTKRAVVFELLQRRHHTAIRWLLRRGFDVYYLYPAEPDPDLGPVYDLQVRGLLRPLRVPDYPFVNISPVANRAFDATERLYPRLERSQSLVSRFDRLYGSADVRLAFKKQLLFELTEYFHCRTLREQLAATVPKETTISLVPIRASHARLSSEFDDAPGSQVDGDRSWRRISFPLWVRLGGEIAALAARLRSTALTAYSVGRALLGAIRQRPYAPESFEFAVAVVSPLREFANDVRGVDFLLDQTHLRRDNTLFVPVVPLPAEGATDMRAKGLAVAASAGPVSWAVALAVAREGLGILRQILSAPIWVTRTASNLLREYWIWSSFAGRYRVGQFVTYADFGIRQIGRNVLLKRQGTQTWYYLDTENLGALNFHNPEPGPRRHHFWGYLYYDHVVAWSDRVADYHSAHQQHVGRYHALGCIWSELVATLHERRPELLIRRRLAERGRTAAHKVVAVFDSSYNDFSRTTYLDGVRFAEAMRLLLAEFPSIYIAWKEKKPRWVHRHVKAIRSSTSGPAALLQVYEELAAHPRCYFAGYDVSASEVLALADLSISFPFTSPTVEALGARQRAIFYAPSERYAGSYFEQIPDLVAKGAHELRDLVQKWLYDTSDDQFGRYLDTRVKDRLDPYLDARGLSRFRRLLAAERRAQPRAGDVVAGR